MEPTYQVELTLEEIELVEHALNTHRNVEVADHKKEQHQGVKEDMAARINRNNVTRANIIGKLTA